MANASRMNEASDKANRMVGPLCDSADCFFNVDGKYLWKSMSKNLQDLTPEVLAGLRREIIRLPETRNLPGSTVPDDFIARFDTGAYALGEMFQYCGRQRAKAIMLNTRGGIAILRQRDLYGDLVNRAEDAAIEKIPTPIPSGATVIDANPRTELTCHMAYLPIHK